MNLNLMTVPQLRKLAAQFNITGRSSMKKDELIRELSDPDIADLVELSIAVDEITPDERTMNVYAEGDAERREIAEQAAYIEEGIERDEAAEQDDAEEIDFNTIPDPDGSNTLLVPDGPWFEVGDILTVRADAEAGELLDAALGEYVEPTADTGKIAITKYAGHEAIATAALGDGSTVGAHITRGFGGRWALMYGSGHVVRAKTLEKVAKRWAQRLGIRATTIDVETVS